MAHRQRFRFDGRGPRQLVGMGAAATDLWDDGGRSSALDGGGHDGWGHGGGHGGQGGGTTTIAAGTGNDTLDGGKENDLFEVGKHGNDVIDGGGGFNTVKFDDSLSNVRNYQKRSRCDDCALQRYKADNHTN